MYFQGKNLKKEQIKTYKDYIKTSAIGLEFSISLLFGIILGFFLDKWFYIQPLGIIFGTIVGVIAAGKILYKFLKKYIDKNSNIDKND
jgi:F0F1-type ATP synthase assembly protein I